MALVYGRKPFGAESINFGSPGGTFGNLWPNGEAYYDVSVKGGGEVSTSDNLAPIFEYDVAVTGGGSLAANIVLIYKYAGSPTRAVNAVAVGPSTATLARPV